MTIKESISAIKSQIPKEVTLVAVSKTKSIEVILKAYQAGQRDFGENKVQELVEKHQHLPKDIRWHFIGHLQRNKVKTIAPFVHLIHGVDSEKLLIEINKRAGIENRVIHCLLQVHIALEESKFGFSNDEISHLLGSEKLQQYKAVCIAGLMGMATNTKKENIVLQEFEDLKLLFDKCKNTPVLSEIDTLSMGMSADYLLAIKKGSTMIRLGSAIFGDRN